MPVRILFCTCPDARTAQTIAETLVEERLAACVNVLPGVQSIYRWEGAIERADEVLLMIKTVEERRESLQARLLALHPAELPELIAVEVVGGLAAYLDWVAKGCLEAAAEAVPVNAAHCSQAKSFQATSTQPNLHTGD